MAERPDLPQIEIASQDDLWTWLDRNHAQQTSVLLVTWKKAAVAAYVGRDAVLDALIAYGWVDGRRYVHDDPKRTIQLISPRKPQPWADSYKRRAAKLEQEGRMHSAGRAVIASAKAAGLWDAAQDVDALAIPGDLAAGLGAHGAAKQFDQMAPSYRRNVLRWLSGAKRQETRDKRIGTIASYAARGEKVPQY